MQLASILPLDFDSGVLISHCSGPSPDFPSMGCKSVLCHGNREGNSVARKQPEESINWDRIIFYVPLALKVVD